MAPMCPPENGQYRGLASWESPRMQVHSLAEAPATFCKCLVGWLSDCVWVSLSVLGETRGAQTGGFLCILALFWVAQGIALEIPLVENLLVPKSPVSPSADIQEEGVSPRDIRPACFAHLFRMLYLKKKKKGSAHGCRKSGL